MRNAHDTYRRVGLETASGPQLMLALYDGMLRFLSQADAAIAERDRQTAHNKLLRCQEIMAELISTLDPSYGEFPQQILDLYIYLYSAMGEANRQQDQEKISEISGIVRRLREAWRGALAQLSAASVAAEADEGQNRLRNAA